MRDRSADAQPTAVKSSGARVICNHCRGRFDSIEAARDHICIGRGGLPGEPARAEAPNGGGPLRGEHRGRLAQAGPRPSLSSKPRAGKAAEDALAALLAGAGYEVIDFRTWLCRALDGTRFTGFVREFVVGSLLAEPRRFRADLFHPASRTCIELEGGAHGIQKQRRGDILRAQLIEAAGLRILRVLPEQATNGDALALVRGAVEDKR